MIQILRKNFDANPGRSTIVLNGKCSDCGCDTIIEITPTSGGFGLQGGALYKCSPDGYFAKCPECFKAGQHENKLGRKKLTQQSIKKSKWLKEKNCKKKLTKN
jgi:hypothetical protein